VFANPLFVDEGITGDVLAALQHAELKELGVGSVGHRLTILKAVYEMKIRQNVPMDPDDYVPLCKSIAVCMAFHV
jgi:hypothetical protein